jgi:hypothetical protein
LGGGCQHYRPDYGSRRIFFGLSRSERVIQGFTNPGAKLTEPGPWIAAVHDLPDKAQALGSVVSVAANVIPRNHRVIPNPKIKIAWARKHVRSMPLFGDLYGDRTLELKYVLVAEQEDLRLRSRSWL